MSQARGHTHGVDSEVGRLRTVLLHRPGLELRRITPLRADRLQFDALPWVGRAQQEHDILAQVLRDQGVEVLYVTELLQDALEYQPARTHAIASVLACATLGDELRAQVRTHLDGLDPEALARVLIAGLTPAELTMGRGVVFTLLDRHDFVIDPLPNLVFAKDASAWIGDRVAVASLAAGPRRREPDLIRVTIRDDGPGIPDGRLAEAAAAGRFGISHSISGRLRDLGGSADISSVAGEGTEVELRLPRGAGIPVATSPGTT